VSRKGRRYTLKSRETKTLLVDVSQRLRIAFDELIDSKSNIEAIETGNAELLLVNRKPLLFRTGGLAYPTLIFEEALSKLSKAVVDMGAVRFVCNGAAIMAPGIVRFEGEFSEGDVVVVVDVKYRKPLALGEVQFDSQLIRKVEKGVVIKNLHYVSDDIWTAIKSLDEM